MSLSKSVWPVGFTRVNLSFADVILSLYFLDQVPRESSWSFSVKTTPTMHKRAREGASSSLALIFLVSRRML